MGNLIEASTAKLKEIVFKGFPSDQPFTVCLFKPKTKEPVSVLSVVVLVMIMMMMLLMKKIVMMRDEG